MLGPDHHGERECAEEDLRRHNRVTFERSIVSVKGYRLPPDGIRPLPTGAGAACEVKAVILRA